MKVFFPFLILLSSFCLCRAAEPDEMRTVSRKNIPYWKAFSLSEVKLNAGYFRQAMERHKEYLLSLEPDRLIPHVRKMAGLEPKGLNYGGWETHGGCSYGHYLSGCALMYAATGDPILSERLDYLLSELKLCQQHSEDGWFISGRRQREGYEELLSGKLLLNQPDETKQPWNYNRNGNSWYCIHKVLAGLRDAYLYAGKEEAKEMLIPLCDFIARIALTSNSDLFQSMLSVEQGGMNEVLADIYAFTGNPDYLKAAERFNHINVIYPTANGEDVLFGRHANDQIPKFVGVLKQYEFEKNELYKKAAENFWEIMIRDHTLAIGGNSCYERFGVPGEESKRLDYSSAETCNTYNMLKLSNQLFQFSGDIKYLNYYEHALYNHILASQDPDMPGCVTYYTSLLPGLFKQYSTPYESFWCCVGTGMENHAKYGEAIYFSGDNELLVNLYIPSELHAKETKLHLVLETRFPESDTVRILVKDNGNFDGNLLLRIPGWLKESPRLLINGFVTDASIENGYLRIKEKLKSKDIITLILPQRLHVRYVKDEPHFGTIMYGPLVLAGELGTEGMPEDRVSNNRAHREALPVKNIPVLWGDLDHYEDWIVRQPDNNPLRFIVNNGDRKKVSLIPYFQLHHQYHTVYWKIYSEKDFVRRARALTDEVIIGDEANEKAHRLTGERDSLRWHDYFWAKNTQYRRAFEGGRFSYDLKINKKEEGPYYLICRFWGDEPEGHEFDILVEGELLRSVDPARRLYLTYIDDIYRIPEERTRGKEVIKVTFKAKEGKNSGGLYGLKITSDPEFR